MMQICETANGLWNECVSAVNFGAMDDYAKAWQEYQAHKRECKECGDYLHGYLMRMKPSYYRNNRSATLKARIR